MKIFLNSLHSLLRRPLYWVAMLGTPLFVMLFMTSLMKEGLPYGVPAAMVDKDGSSLSRQVTMDLAAMQTIDLSDEFNSFTEARHAVQDGRIFGFFLIPENFERDLLAAKSPTVTFYTNMTYFVPASILFKTFKTTALLSKAGVVLQVVDAAGGNSEQAMPLIQPVSIDTRALHNPTLNYAVYLCNSFLPCVVQLMILLTTCMALGEEIKRGSSVRLMTMAGGNPYRAVIQKLLPQTLIYWAVVIFMVSWLYCWEGYPMNGSWWWFMVSEILFVPACQAMAVIIFGILPNLRLALSLSALSGILSFSVAAFSFPVQSMYPAVGIFSWLMPIRYNFLIYIDQALNGIDPWYSRWWYAAYLIYFVVAALLIPRIGREFRRPVYIP